MAVHVLQADLARAETAAQQGDAQQLLPVQPGADLSVPQYGEAAEDGGARLLGLHRALIHGAVFVFRRIRGAERAQQGAPLPLFIAQDLPCREKLTVAVPVQLGLQSVQDLPDAARSAAAAVHEFLGAAVLQQV